VGDAFFQRAIELEDHVSSLVSRRGEADFDRQDMLRIEAQVRMEIARDHAHQQPGDNQQHKSEGHLRNHKGGANTRLAAACAGAAAGLKGAIGIDAGEAQRG